MNQKGEINFAFCLIILVCSSLLLFLLTSRIHAYLKFKERSQQILCLERYQKNFKELSENIVKTNNYIKYVALAKNVSILIPGMGWLKVAGKAGVETLKLYQESIYKLFQTNTLKQIKQCSMLPNALNGPLQGIGILIKRDSNQLALLTTARNIFVKGKFQSVIAKIFTGENKPWFKFIDHNKGWENLIPSFL